MDWTTGDVAAIGIVNAAVLSAWLIVWGVPKIVQFFVAVVGR